MNSPYISPDYHIYPNSYSYQCNSIHIIYIHITESTLINKQNGHSIGQYYRNIITIKRLDSILKIINDLENGYKNM